MNYLDKDESSKLSIQNKKDSGLSKKLSITDPEFFYNSTGLSPREHSKQIDSFLGFRILRIERKLIQQYRSFYLNDKVETSKKLHSDNGEEGESWIGLNPQVLLTPYSELYEIFYLLRNKSISKIIDIGCAYGRVGIVSKAFFPNSEFIGYEIVKKRITEAKRISDLYDLEMNIESQNVLEDSFELPKSSLYFIYDFSHVGHIKNILQKLESRIGKHPFILVAKGDEIRSIIQLAFPMFIVKNEPCYRENWSIFFLD